MAVFSIPSAEVPNAVGMGGKDFRPREGEKDGVRTPKLSPDGRPTFASGVVVGRDDGGQDKGATIAIIEVPAEPWALGQALKADGLAWITPYVTESNRQGLSFVVERLVPVESTPVVPTPAKRGGVE